MNYRITTMLFGLALATGGVVLGGASCDQPQVPCAAARGGFAAKFTLKSGSGSCAELKGQVVGLQTYSPADDSGVRQDFSKVTLAIQAEEVGNLKFAADSYGVADPDPKHKLFSLGAFTSAEPEGDVCSVPSFSAAEIAAPEVPPTPCEGTGGAGGAGGAGAGGGDATGGGGGAGGAGTGGAGGAAGTGGADGTGGGGGAACEPDPGLPATHLKYQWSNLRLLVRADTPGTQFAADLKYTNDECTAEYSVVGLYPAVPCEGVDAEGNPTGVPDDSQCLPDPGEGRPFGSGINPDFPVKCDPDVLLCVLTKPFPAFK